MAQDGRTDAEQLYEAEEQSDGSSTIVIDSHILEGVHPRDYAQTISDYFKKELQGKTFDLGDGTGAKMNSKSRNKMIQMDEDLGVRGKMTKDLPDILKYSKKTRDVLTPDSKNHAFARDGFEYRKTRVRVGNKEYEVKINIGVTKGNKTFYTINNIKEIPQSSPNGEVAEGVSSTNIANTPRIVKGSRRYRRPAVSADEVTSKALQAEGIVMTKTDFNNALDEVIALKYPELFEKSMMLEAELQALGDLDPIQLGGAIRPQDAQHLFGKNYTEWLPRNFIRKDALPLDIQAQERGFSDPNNDK